MKFVKRTAEYTVLKRRDERYAVQANDGSFINAEEKLKILIAEGLIKAPEPKAEPEAPAEETAEGEEQAAAE